jgi:hypothetical protein
LYFVICFIGKENVVRYGVLVVALSLAVMTNSSFGDEIILKNGNQLTGKVKQLVEGKLVFESELAGTVTIDISDVQTFSSDAPIEVHLGDRSQANSPWRARTP